MADPSTEISNIDFSNMIGSPLLAAIEAQSRAALSTVNFIKSVGFTGPGPNDPQNATGDPVYVAFKYPREVAPYQPATTAFEAQIDQGGAGFDPTNPPTFVIAPADTSGRPARGVAVVGSDGVVVGATITDPGQGFTNGENATVTLKAPSGGSDAAVKLAANITPAKPAILEQMTLEVPLLTIIPIPCVELQEITIDFNAKINSMEKTQTDTDTNFSGELDASVGWGPISAKMHVSAAYQSKTSVGSEVQRTYSLDVHVRATQAETPPGLERVLAILEASVLTRPTSTGTPKVVSTAAGGMRPLTPPRRSKPQRAEAVCR